ncbi:unnamed protein product, partial [Heterosigma akashiwo]
AAGVLRADRRAVRPDYHCMSESVQATKDSFSSVFAVCIPVFVEYTYADCDYKHGNVSH